MADEVKVTGGAGWFFFACVPGVLAGALLMYLAFYTGVIDWQKTQRIEGRMDNRVGVHGELVKPVDLIIRKAGCVQVSRAYLDDGSLTAYLTNNCHEDVDYWELHWNSIAPDGTIITSGYTNHSSENGTGLGAGETIELKEDIKDDSRTVKVVVWGTNKPEVCWRKPKHKARVTALERKKGL